MEHKDSSHHWWDHLPSQYVVKRKWTDIAKFHEELENELAFDPKQGCRRVKALVPKLPDRGELHEFLLGVAATGDSRALNAVRVGKHEKMTGKTKAPWEELDVMYTIYAENRLTPYLVEVNKILQELPEDVMQASKALRNFVSYGSSGCKKPDFAAMKQRWFGPGPVYADPEAMQVLARQYRQQRASEPDGKARGKDQAIGSQAGGSPGPAVVSPTGSSGPSPTAARSASAPDLHIGSRPGAASVQLPTLGLPGHVQSQGASASQTKPRWRRSYFLRSTGPYGDRVGGDTIP